MTKMLLLDTEQAAIIEDAAETAVRLLNYRMERADPDQVISASIKLQTRKIEQVKRQLALPSITKLADMTESRRESVLKAARLLTEARDAKMQDRVFEILFSEIAGSREEHAKASAGFDGSAVAKPNPRAPKDAR